MKPIYAIAAGVPLLAFAAAAQEAQSFQIRMMGVQGAVMGKTVKGAPYSGTEVNETNQVLADGTRIHNETQTQVWRDSEGRVRRETPKDIMIYDPVANASYVLNPKTQTARKLPLGTYVFTSGGEGKTMVQYFRFSTSEGPVDAEHKVAELKGVYTANHPDMRKAEQELAIRKAEQDHLEAGRMLATEQVKRATRQVTETLGRRTMEGVNADGTRETSTIDAGAIGNDRPIQSVTERWFSPELQTLMSSRHSDPRTGEETFKLINVSRTEPPAYLFQIPAGYQMQ